MRLQKHFLLLLLRGHAVGILFIPCFLFRQTRGECVQTDSCSCRDNETDESITLLGLSRFEGSQGAFFEANYTSYTYYFNPCFNVDVAGCKDVAVCRTDNNSNTSLPLASQLSARFEDSENDLAILYEYTGTDNVTFLTKVHLHCPPTPNATDTTFTARATSVYQTFEFDLTTPCACFGRTPASCSAMPVSCQIQGENRCQCRYSDGRGLINLESLDDVSSPLVVQLDDSPLHQAAFNPCTGFNWARGQFDPGLCRNSTACLEPIGDQWFDYGVPWSGYFSTGNDPSDLTLMYWSEDRQFRTEIKLVCDKAQRRRPLLTARKGMPTQRVLELELRSVCACPDACLPQQRTCTAQDSCTCQLSQNLGRIDLHELDNGASPLLANNSSDSILYYNPCSPFTIPGKAVDCINVSACQLFPTNASDVSLGTQEMVSFHANPFTNEVTAFYQGGTNGRHFAVELKCDWKAVEAKLSFLGESATAEYGFSLRSRCACPDGC